MTACIAPKGMGNTILQNPNIRKSQYLEAIDFYLKETEYNIVFCENTGTNIFDEIQSKVKFSRLEYITFNGNDYDKQRGKGYGEAKIIQYAIRNSKYLQRCNSIIKITGRVKILNMNELATIIMRKERVDNVVALEFLKKNWANSVCFFSPKDWLLKTIEKDISILYDMGYNFEKMIYMSIVETKGIKICRYHPFIEGICGGLNMPYPNFSMPQRKLNHFSALRHLYRSRAKRLNYAIATICWGYYVVERKIYVRLMKP